MKPNVNFTDIVAIITDASCVIYYAAAIELANLGVRLVLVARCKEKLSE